MDLNTRGFSMALKNELGDAGAFDVLGDQYETEFLQMCCIA
jgi:hypothetical protein